MNIKNQRILYDINKCINEIKNNKRYILAIVKKVKEENMDLSLVIENYEKYMKEYNKNVNLLPSLIKNLENIDFNEFKTNDLFF